MANETMTFGSLFAGIGGFDVGFERAGMACEWQVEIDDRCNRVLDHHWPNVQRYGDVRETGKHNLGAVDLICGGFPCQDVSVAGKRKGLAGKRSGLWFEFHRVLAELTPRWVVIENVPGLLSSNGGRDFAVILQGLAEIGYLSTWRVLDAQYFGVAQRRRRVFIVGSLGDGSCAEVLFEREGGAWDSPPSREARATSSADSEKRLRAGGAVAFDWTADGSKDKSWRGKPRSWIVKRGDYAGALSVTKTQAIAAPLTRGSAVGEGVNEPGQRREDDVNLVAAPITGFRTEPGEHLIAWHENKQGELTVDSDNIAKAMRSGASHSYQGISIRRFTPTECECLQGFPDGWTSGQPDSVRYRQLGNAVAVPVAEWIGRQIVQVAK